VSDPNHVNPKNWSRGPVKLYFAHDDPRLWVPKFVPAMGWTINCAHPAAGAVLVGVILLPVLVVAVVIPLFARV
jgi:uncharacterized membrane protein